MTERVSLPPSPPSASFASDNASGVHPTVLQAMVGANAGGVAAYGDDPWTRRAERLFDEVFGAKVDTAFCWGGTGANVVSLSTLLRPWNAVICTEDSHINTDECGAPERLCGAKLLTAASPDAKLRPEQIDDLARGLGNQHHSQPKVVSITQSTEAGTLYSIDEVADLCDRARSHGLRVHMDGARIANAVVALGCDVSEITRDVGVDVVSFGGTKNGMMYGEAVVWFDPTISDVAFARKQAAQLPSKMRFVSAQFEAMLTDDLWLANAARANTAALHLADSITPLECVELVRRPAVNSLFVRMDPALLRALRDWSFFWEWDASSGEARWMTSFDTTEAEVDAFVAGVEWFGSAASAT